VNFVTIFQKKNHKEYNNGLKTFNRESLNFIVGSLNNRDYSMAYIERALDLPQRTLSQWKKDGISASGIALMKTVFTFPWILHAADEDFDATFSAREVIRQAAELLPSPDFIGVDFCSDKTTIYLDYNRAGIFGVIETNLTEPPVPVKIKITNEMEKVTNE